jgi:HSP20 family protein
MFVSFSDPFEALLTLQRALDARIASDWMGRGTAAIGSFPPINMFQKGEDLVAVIELPGIDKNDLEIEAKENICHWHECAPRRGALGFLLDFALLLDLQFL